MKPWISTISTRSREFWINVFWKSPNHLWALKVTVSIVFLVLSGELLFSDSFVGTTMALGVVAMALGETDVHPKGRMKSAGIALILFLSPVASLNCLLPFHPILLCWYVLRLSP